MAADSIVRWLAEKTLMVNGGSLLEILKENTAVHHFRASTVISSQSVLHLQQFLEP